MNDMQAPRAAEPMSIKDKTMQILELDDDERARKSESQFANMGAQLEQVIAAAVMQAMGQVAAAFKPMQQELRQLRAEVAELKKPQKITMGGIKTDESGRITSAEATKSVQ